MKFFQLFGTFFVSELPSIRMTENYEVEVSRTKYLAILGHATERSISNALDALEKAVRRGVKIQLLLDTEKQEQRIIECLRNLGCEVKHYPTQGFTLSLTDDYKVKIELNDANGSSGKIAFCLTDKVMAREAEIYFSELWQKSVSLDDIRRNNEGY